MSDNPENIGNAQVTGTEAGAAKQTAPRKAIPPKAKASKPKPTAKAKAKPSGKSAPKKKKAEGITLKTFPNFDVTSPDEEVDAVCRDEESEMGDSFSTMQGDSDKAMDDAFAGNEVF